MSNEFCDAEFCDWLKEIILGIESVSNSQVPKRWRAFLKHIKTEVDYWYDTVVQYEDDPMEAVQF